MNGPNLWPVNTLLMSNYLPIPAWDVGTQVTGARGAEHSGFFLLARGTVGPWVPVPALCQGASAQGVESPQNDKTACSSVLTSWYPCCNSIWKFYLLSSRKNKLNRMVRDNVAQRLIEVEKLPGA